MKKALFLIQVIAFSTLAFGQDVPDERVHMHEEAGHKSFWYTGESAKQILQKLYGGEVPAKNIHKFSETQIAGLGDPLTVKVMEGIHYVDEKGGGFHTYTSNKDRVKYLSNLREGLEPGIVVHFYRGKEDVVDTPEEENAALAYLRSLHK